jgi:SAM-dependent methyltransferase
MSKFGGYEDEPFLADLYDLVPAYSNRQDLGFYVDLCRSGGGKVLELGCGTGRLVLPMASRGLTVVGLDFSEHLLAKCREKVSAQPQEVQARIRLVRANMTDFHLHDTFNTVIIPFRPFQHLLAVEDQLACLRCAKAHLEPGGRLAFDCFQVSLRKITDPRRMEETEDVPEFELPDGRRMRRCNRIVATHSAEQYNDVEIIYYLTDTTGKTERLVQGFPFRYFFRYEVEHLLERAGFEVADLYGDFDRSPFSDESPEMIFVARNPADHKRAEATQ